jgi:hypothetical protein
MESRRNRGWALRLCALALGMGLAASASASPWSFGVMADSQWTTSDPAAANPNSVPVSIINQINTRFISAGVEFVIQVGDLTNDGSNAALDTRASAAQALYDAGIGFYPLRGNHEGSQAAALRFQTDFPQTQGSGSHVLGATSFSSPATNLNGLSYSFDFNNARFVLLDQFTRTDGTGSTDDNILDQQTWITSRLDKNTRGTEQAFVFAHKNLIGENHTDVLFGANPTSNAAGQNSFFASLQDNGVKYVTSGHDHVYQRSIIASPNGQSTVQQIIAGSDSSKFYAPTSPSRDIFYNGSTGRETSVAQKLNTLGYSIYTVDGPRVTVDYYADQAGGFQSDGSYPYGPSSNGTRITPTLNFVKQETFGYSLNGISRLVAQGASYALTDNTAAAIARGEAGYLGTTAALLSGINGSILADGSGRALTKEITTGWTSRAAANSPLLESDVLSLWGMTDMGQAQTDPFVLQMSYDASFDPTAFGAIFGLRTKDMGGNWILAGDTFLGDQAALAASAGNVGKYGYSSLTHTAWAVLDHSSDFAVAVPEPTAMSLLAFASLLVLRRRGAWGCAAGA